MTLSLTRLPLIAGLVLLTACSQKVARPDMNPDLSGTIHGPDEVMAQQEVVVSATTGSETGKQVKRRWLSSDPQRLKLQHTDDVAARYLAADVQQDTTVYIQLQLDNGESQLLLQHPIEIKANN
ncbi:hypothetical protein CHH28_08720 [Bacterioplanes sanyensis]|uniref:Uncharacterized protein n=1 Tax=Bacterioplanes sanyensis TaxID=1249553 RepID=A0A222FJ34_9GAMM|nr:hypothetical protein [Bacterioplanes sanyensis]ASP38759.1 hypothetical protein CHH28_08720 [Bacterioplanes sanyensis]